MVSQKNWFMLFGFGLLGIGVLALAILSGIWTPQAGSLTSTTTPGGTTETGATTATPFFDTSAGVTVGVASRESIADTTGVKNLYVSTADVYKDGQTSPYVSILTTTTGFTAAGTTANAGEKVFVVTNATNYYFAKSDLLTVPAQATFDVTLYGDHVNTLALTMENTTAGSWATSGMKQNLITDEAASLELRLEGQTARGVYRKPLVCANYETSNFTRVEVIGGVKTEVPSGIANGYEECWTSGLDTVNHYDKEVISVRLTPTSGVNPDSNVTLLVADYGNYKKAVNDILFDGYQNGDTLADVGATNYNFVIDVD